VIGTATGEVESASDRAYRLLRDAIVKGECPPGTMLGEGTLATQYGVSRTPIRGALARLQDEGWITVYPKRGALVRGLTDRDIADLVGARLMLETSSVALATPEDRSNLAGTLRMSIEKQKHVLERGNIQGFIELTVAFHRSFVQIGQNAIVIELGDRLADRQRFLLNSHGDRLLSRIDDTIAEHSALVDHLSSGDINAFEQALRLHLDDTHAPSPALRATHR
jgi:DNA-binding GntR family transcriptional regulator